MHGIFQKEKKQFLSPVVYWSVCNRQCLLIRFFSLFFFLFFLLMMQESGMDLRFCSECQIHSRADGEMRVYCWTLAKRFAGASAFAVVRRGKNCRKETSCART